MCAHFPPSQPASLDLCAHFAGCCKSPRTHPKMCALFETRPKVRTNGPALARWRGKKCAHKSRERAEREGNVRTFAGSAPAVRLVCLVRLVRTPHPEDPPKNTGLLHLPQSTQHARARARRERESGLSDTDATPTLHTDIKTRSAKHTRQNEGKPACVEVQRLSARLSSRSWSRARKRRRTTSTTRTPTRRTLTRRKRKRKVAQTRALKVQAAAARRAVTTRVAVERTRSQPRRGRTCSF